MMTPEQFAADFILHWEDGSKTDPLKTHSMDRRDAGNWTGGKPGVGTLVGSNHGVTAAAMAAYRKVPVASITFQMMHNLAMVEAVAIALANYFRAPGFDKLPWNAVTASIMDFGWGAGPVHAEKEIQATEFQDMIGTTADAFLGPVSISRYVQWLADRTIEQAAKSWAFHRIAYYETIIARIPADAAYRNGWRNRSLYYTPDDPLRAGWWARFHA